ncbi:F-box protein CPR30 [Striga hermonthica]|uniref:F-box protein CPR30 n=1 Tax=Striga hermonthica TaxID=68872 RepID=A0A9N7RAS9_STRHE|nr:F-box protein CPR30 [Striga hermonthica]
MRKRSRAKFTRKFEEEESSQELVEDILRRLPVKSLKRFRAVARSWHSLIDNEPFAKSHLRRSLSTASNRHLLISLEFLAVDLGHPDGAVPLRPPFCYRTSDGFSNYCNGVSSPCATRLFCTTLSRGTTGCSPAAPSSTGPLRNATRTPYTGWGTTRLPTITRWLGLLSSDTKGATRGYHRRLGFTVSGQIAGGGLKISLTHSHFLIGSGACTSADPLIHSSWIPTKMKVWWPLALRRDFLSPLVYSADGDKVLLSCNDFKLVWFDSKEKSVCDVDVQGLPYRFYAEVCIESLIRLSEQGKETKRIRGKKEKIGKKRDDFLSEGFNLVL